MKRISARPLMLIVGMMSISAIGCITGTNTFSNAMVPATRYCSIDDIPALVTGIPAPSERSPAMSKVERNDATGDQVSLVP